jgi:hypothetical protein
MDRMGKINGAHVGKVVESVRLCPARDALAIVFDDNTSYVLVAEGDCCANAWIEAVESFGFKGRFLGISSPPDREDKSGDDPTSPGDVLDINFYDFRTDHGRLLVELRTSHNGYYSGRLTEDSNHPIGADWKLVE